MVTSTQGTYDYSLEHSPTLNTVLMVEETLKNMDESVIKIADLKKKLPKQVNHNTLKIILEYLEMSNKILVTMKGITWIHNTNPNLRKVIKEGLRLWTKNKLHKGKSWIWNSRTKESYSKRVYWQIRC